MTTQSHPLSSLSWPSFLTLSSISSSYTTTSPYQYTPLTPSSSSSSTLTTTMAKPTETIVNVPAQESTGSKLKSFFRRDKKAKTVLSERDARVLEQVKRRAKVLDTGVDLGCAKIGLDPIIGLIPVAGDMITVVMALNLVRTAQKADIPRSLSRKMLFNVVIDFTLGLVPVLGDIADFVFKANDRNARLFEEYLYARAAQDAEDEEAKAKKNHLNNVLHQHHDSSSHTKEAIPLESVGSPMHSVK